MPEEREYKITCNMCGYSEVVPEARLPYEEGKTCPICKKGKMYWVPATEEARRREFGMPQERKISPYWLIPVGLLLGVGGAWGLAAAIAWGREAPPTPPPGQANLYGRVTDAATGDPISGVLVTLNGMQVFTDAYGNYAFADIELGGYRLEFSKAGYQTLIY